MLEALLWLVGHCRTTVCYTYKAGCWWGCSGMWYTARNKLMVVRGNGWSREEGDYGVGVEPGREGGGGGGVNAGDGRPWSCVVRPLVVYCKLPGGWMLGGLSGGFR